MMWNQHTFDGSLDLIVEWEEFEDNQPKFLSLKKRTDDLIILSVHASIKLQNIIFIIRKG